MTTFALAHPPLDAIDATVDTLCELQRRSGISLAIEVGRAVVEGIYGGDLDRLRDRTNDCPTLRTLAAHPRMPFNLTALHQAIGIYCLVERVPGLLDTELTATHLRSVLPYADVVQDALLSRAVAEGWTTKRLQQAAREIKPARGKGGRPRQPRAVKTLNHLDRLAGEESAWADLDELAALPAERREVLARKLRRLRRYLRGVQLRLAGESGAGVADGAEAAADGATEAPADAAADAPAGAAADRTDNRATDREPTPPTSAGPA